MATNPPQSQIGLTADELKELEAGGARIQALHKELDKAESAGLDVSELREILNEAEKLRAGMLRVYGSSPIRRRG